VVGIDVDAHKGDAEMADWLKLLDECGPLPDTAPWCTSRDDGISGIRLFRVPDGYMAADMGPAGEVIQHHHRYVVAPPSISPPPPRGNSKQYRWIGRPDDWIPLVKHLPPLPEAWLNRLQAGTTTTVNPLFQQPGQRVTTWTNPDVGDLIANGIPAGVTQDNYLRDVTWKPVTAGLDELATRAVWEAVAGKTPQRPGEPWTARDFERHYSRAAKKVMPAQHAPGEEQERTRLDQLRGALLDSDGLDNLPAPEPLIDGLLFRDSLAWLHGKPGHGKSLLALDQACCIAAGLPWMDRPVSGGPVLYVIAEGATGLRARVRAWEDRAGQKTGVRFLPVAVQMLQLGEPEAVAALAGELACALVVLDTQARVSVGADENSSQDMGRLVEAADKIRMASGACVQLVHHEARAGENMRGSTALEGAATTILRAVKDGSRLELTNPKQKDAAEADPVTLWVVPRLQSVVIAGKPDSPTLDLRADSENKILTALLDLFGTTGAAATTLREATGLSKSTFHWALNRLVKDGLVQNLG
jgi:AAA domain/Bifunctional DNA primase/polymerase, N-terminal